MKKAPTWHNDPPTEPQLSYLKNLGYVGSKPRTKGTAAELIAKYIQCKEEEKELADLQKREWL